MSYLYCAQYLIVTHLIWSELFSKDSDQCDYRLWSVWVILSCKKSMPKLTACYCIWKFDVYLAKRRAARGQYRRVYRFSLSEMKMARIHPKLWFIHQSPCTLIATKYFLLHRLWTWKQLHHWQEMQWIKRFLFGSEWLRMHQIEAFSNRAVSSSKVFFLFWRHHRKCDRF